MKFEFSIWMFNQNTNKYSIERHIVLEEEEFEDLVLEKFKTEYNYDEAINIEYSARLDETII